MFEVKIFLKMVLKSFLDYIKITIVILFLNLFVLILNTQPLYCCSVWGLPSDGLVVVDHVNGHLPPPRLGGVHGEGEGVAGLGPPRRILVRDLNKSINHHGPGSKQINQ